MGEHKVTFRPSDLTIEIDPELYPFGRHGDPGSLLDIALAHGVQLAHACGGTGVCGTCHVIVEAGGENLSDADEDELDTIDRVPGNNLNSRLACRAIVRGDVTVRIPAGDTAGQPD